MKFWYYINEGDLVPWYLGSVRFDYSSGKWLATYIVINWLIAFGLWISYKLSRAHVLTNNPRAAYIQGRRDARKDIKDMQALKNRYCKTCGTEQ